MSRDSLATSLPSPALVKRKKNSVTTYVILSVLYERKDFLRQCCNSGVSARWMVMHIDDNTLADKAYSCSNTERTQKTIDVSRVVWGHSSELTIITSNRNRGEGKKHPLPTSVPTATTSGGPAVICTAASRLRSKMSRWHHGSVDTY